MTAPRVCLNGGPERTFRTLSPERLPGGPKRLQEAFKRPPRSPSKLQEAPKRPPSAVVAKRHPKIAPRGIPKIAPRRPKRPPRRPKRPPRRLQEWA